MHAPGFSSSSEYSSNLVINFFTDFLASSFEYFKTLSVITDHFSSISSFFSSSDVAKFPYHLYGKIIPKVHNTMINITKYTKKTRQMFKVSKGKPIL